MGPSSCTYCGGRLAVDATSCANCGHTPGAASPSSDEAIFVDEEHGVRVTKTLLIVPSQTYVLDKIHSLRVVVEKPGESEIGNAAGVMGVGVVIAMCGVLFMSSQNGGFGFLLFAVGCVVLYAGYRMLRSRRSKHILVLTTAAGEVPALVDSQREVIERVAHALNEAIAARG